MCCEKQVVPKWEIVTGDGDEVLRYICKDGHPYLRPVANTTGGVVYVSLVRHDHITCCDAVITTHRAALGVGTWRADRRRAVFFIMVGGTTVRRGIRHLAVGNGGDCAIFKVILVLRVDVIMVFVGRGRYHIKRSNGVQF